MSNSAKLWKKIGHIVGLWGLVIWPILGILQGAYWKTLPVGSGQPLLLPWHGNLLIFGLPAIAVVAGLVVLVAGIAKRLVFAILEGLFAIASGIVLLGIILFSLALGSIT